MQRFCFVVILCGLSLASAAPASATDLVTLYPTWQTQNKFYVKPTGNDSKNGKSIANAWKTIRKAASVAKQGDTVIVAPGTYQDTDTIYFNQTSSGTSTCIYYADTTGLYFSGGGDVIIMAPKTLSNWTWYVHDTSRYAFSGFRFIEDPTSNLPNYDVVTNQAQHDAYMANWNSYVHTHAFVAYKSSKVALHNCSFKQFRHAAHFSITTDCATYDCSYENTGYMQLYVAHSKGFQAKDCSFTAPAPRLSLNSGFLMYSVYSEATATNCVFDTQGVYQQRELLGTSDPFKVRYIHLAYNDGLLYDPANYNLNITTYNSSGGKFTADGCTFRYGVEHAAAGSWMESMTVRNCSFVNCRYGIHGHSEQLNVDNNTINLSANCLWQNEWNFGVYANRFNSANNRSYQNSTTAPNYVRVAANPVSIVKGTTITNYRYGLYIGSNDISLSNLTITGNTDYTYAPSTGWVGTRQTNAVYVGVDANSVTFNGADNLTLSGHWCAFKSDGPDMVYNAMTITAIGNGCEHSSCNATFLNTIVENCGSNGATHWSCKKLTASNSQFNNNGAFLAGGWGLYFYGTKNPRTPNNGSNPNYDAYVETYLYGTCMGEVDMSQCKFNGNGHGAGGGGGLFLAYLNKNHITLYHNEITNNYWHGLYLFDGEWNLANNNEFSKISGNQCAIWINGYRSQTDHSDPYRSCKATISGYTLKDSYYGIGANDSDLTVANTSVSDCQLYGIAGWNGHLRCDGVNCTKNYHGLVAQYNFTTDIKNSAFNENLHYGAIVNPFEKFYGTSRTYTCVLDHNEFNRNTDVGLYIYAVNHTAAGVWDVPSPTRYAVSNATCNNNVGHGLIMYYGWFVENPNLNIECNNNGSYSSSGDGNWGTGLYVVAPQCNIQLADTLGIHAANNSWAGMYFNNYYWRADPTTGKYHFTVVPSNFTVQNFTQGPNKYYGLRVSQFQDVSVANSAFSSGVLFEDTWGAIALDNSTFDGCYYGANISWGNNSYYRDLATGVVVDSWWNTTVVLPSTLAFKPASINVTDCEFKNSLNSGLTATWWYRWEDASKDAEKRLTIHAADSSFKTNNVRGIEIYNNDLQLQNCSVDHNGLSGAVVWDGGANFSNSTFNENGLGRWNGTAHGFWPGTKWSWVACEVNHSTVDGRKHSYLIDHCTFSNNDCNGLYLGNNNGANGIATVTDCTANDNLNSGLYLAYADATITRCQANRNGGTTAWTAHGIVSLYNNVQLVDCTANENTATGLYAHGFYVYDSADSQYYAQGNHTATISNCNANNNWGTGILAWCNSATITNSTALATWAPESTNTSGTGIQIGFDDKNQTYTHTLSGCSASGGWAGLYALNTRATVDNCHFDGSRYGGYHHNSQSHRNLGRCSVVNSTMNGNGCYGIDHYDTPTTLQFVQCNRNGKSANGVATGNGGYGAIFTDSWRGIGGPATQHVADCQLNDNANHGMYAHYQAALTLERCQINNNPSYGIYADHLGSATFKNNLVAGNYTGIFLDSQNGAFQVWNNTITGSQYMGLRPYRGTGEIRNNIIHGAQYGLFFDSATVVASNNLVHGNSVRNYYQGSLTDAQLTAPGDVNKPPRFENAAAGDYRLNKGSPAINAGYNAQGIVDDDLVGTARPKFKKHEIGAYEFTDPNGSLRVLDWQENR